VGGSAGDVLNGGGGGDRLVGNDGADTLVGGGDGLDTLVGEEDGDRYVLSSAGTQVVETGTRGRDEVQTTLASLALSRADLTAVEDLSFTDVQVAGNFVGYTGSGNALANVVTGASGADSFTGDANDTLVGNAGDDVFTVLAGSVALSGGQGIDTALTALAGYTLATGNGVENLAYTGAGASPFTGTGNELANSISGGAGGDSLVGNAGADTLDGRAGADTLDGGTGNDVYLLDDAGDQVVETAPGDIDEVRTTLSSLSLGRSDLTSVENLTFTGAGPTAFAGTGNTLANVITGGAGADTLLGMAGADTLVGNDGADQLASSGGGGSFRTTGPTSGATNLAAASLGVADFMSGSSNTAGYTLAFKVAGTATGFSLLSIGRIQDAATTGQFLQFGLNGDQSMYWSLTGGSQYGASVASARDGSWHAVAVTVDTANTATFYYDGRVVGTFANVGLMGTPTQIRNVNLSSSSASNAFDDVALYTRALDATEIQQLATTDGAGIASGLLARWSFDGATPATPTATAAGSSVGSFNAGGTASTIRGFEGGNDGNESFSGGAGADTIDAANGNDTLDGGAGVDVLRGGGGNDLYVVDSVSDRTFEYAGAGTDTVRTTLSAYSLDANVENLAFADATGAALATAASGNGNRLANIIQGGDGADTLSGRAGSDTVLGGAGNDRLEEGSFATNSSASISLPVTPTGFTLFFDAYSAGASAVSFRVGGTVHQIWVWSSGLQLQLSGQGLTSLVSADLSDWQGLAVRFVQSGSAWSVTYAANGTVLATQTVADSGLIGATLTSVGGSGSGIDNLTVYATPISDTQLMQGTRAGGLMPAGDATTPFARWTFDSSMADSIGGVVMSGAATSHDASGAGNVMDGQVGDDTIVGGAGNDTLVGGAGADSLSGGAGTDLLDYATSAAGVTVNLLARTASGGDATGDQFATDIENLRGSATAASSLTGNASANSISGGNGADTIDGGAGNDTMVGGQGDDTYVVDAAGDVTTEAAGEGFDTIRTALTSVSLAGRANIESIVYTGSGAVSLVGSGLDGELLQGGSGNDTLDGAGGADTLVGLGGNDLYLLRGGREVITEAPGGGTDSIQVWFNNSAGAEYVMADNVENATNMLATGMRLAGNALANSITGGTGDDTLRGGVGDTLVGAAGDDTYVVDTAGYRIVEASGGGTDTVRSALAGFAIGANVENLTFTDAAGTPISAAAFGNGNNLANVITGGTGADTLSGRSGADTVIGGGGDDLLEEGRYATSSTATLNVPLSPATGFTVFLDVAPTGVNSFQISAGSAFVRTFVTPTYMNLQLSGQGASSAFNYDLSDWQGIALRGVLSGSTWTFTFAAGGTVLGSVTAADNGLGSQTTLTSLFVGLNSDNVTLYNSAISDAQLMQGTRAGGLMAAGDPTSPAARWTFDSSMTSSVGGYTFSGTSTAYDTASTGNRLDGQDGNDTLVGGLGADTMIGGRGDDTFTIDYAGDVVTENAGEGFDTIRTTFATASLSGQANIEGLAYIGAGAASLSGTAAGGESIQGAAGNDTLDGSGGGDTLVGLGGNDTYDLRTAADVVVEASGGGTDTLRLHFDASAGPAYVLAANVENATNMLASNILLTGNALANSLVGGSGTDTLSGVSGDDTLAGGAGTDSLSGDDGNDLLLSRGSGAMSSASTVASLGTADFASGAYTVAFKFAGTAATASSTLGIGRPADPAGQYLSVSLLTNSQILFSVPGVAGTSQFFNTGGFRDGAWHSVVVSVNASGAGTVYFDGSSIGTLGSGVLGTPANIRNVLLSGPTANSFDDVALYTKALSLSEVQQLRITDGSTVTDNLLARWSFDDTNVAAPTATGAGTSVGSFDSAALPSALRGAEGSADGNETFAGGAGNDTIEAGQGNDTLDGGTGNDRLSGGAGNDLYIVDASLDTVVENPGGGTDTVRTSLTAYGLGVNVETLAFADAAGTPLAAGVYGAGNNLANAITGGDGADTLAGRGGSDTLVGGKGDDVLDVGTYASANGSANVGIPLSASTGFTLFSDVMSSSLIQLYVGAGTPSVGLLVWNTGLQVQQNGTTNAAFVANTNTDWQQIALRGVLTGSTWTFTLASGGNIIATQTMADQGFGSQTSVTRIWSNMGAGHGVDNLTYYASALTDAQLMQGTRASGLMAAGDPATAAARWTFDSTGNLGGFAWTGITSNYDAGATTGKVMDGQEGNDTLLGGSANDTLSGGTGADSVSAGAGNDSITVTTGGDTVDGGAGTDTVDFTGTSGLAVDLAAATDQYVLTASGARGLLANVEAILGSAAAANRIGGTNAAETFTGGSAADTLIGAGGSDRLNGGTGDDLIQGAQAGLSWLAATGGTVLQGLLDATQTNTSFGVGATATFSMSYAFQRTNPAETGRLQVIVANAYSSGAQFMQLDVMGDGKTFQLALNTTPSATVLGTWTLGASQSSNDGNWHSVTLSVNAGVGTLYFDGVAVGSSQSLALWTGPNTSERYFFAQGNGAAGRFDDLAFYNTAVSASEAQALATAGPSAVPSGLLSAWTFDGGNAYAALGSGSLAALRNSANMLSTPDTGTAGNDTLDGDVGNDTLRGGNGNDSITAGDGNDAVFGSFGNDTLLGGNGNDTLDGTAGNDSLAGGAGDDTYVVRGSASVGGAAVSITENAGEGTDTVVLEILNIGAADTYVLPVNVENLTYTGVMALRATGNAADNVMVSDGNAFGADTLDGAGGNDSLMAGRGNDSLVGGTTDAGNDTLDGGTGNDTMAGGAGDDLYVVDATADVIAENAGEGNDTVRVTALSYTLSGNIETMIYTGAGNFSGVGNAGANSIVSGTGNDTLDGGGGGDTLSGDGGNDTYDLRSASDVVIEASGGGTDTVRLRYDISAGPDYVILANIENATNMQATGASIVGNALANVIAGGSGNDTLRGGDNDSLAGGAGNDTYYVDGLGMQVTEAGSAGTDALFTGLAVYALDANVETLTYFRASGATDLNVQYTGNAVANVITTGAGNDTLFSASGNDTLVGGLGNDTYYLSAATDQVVDTGGVDTIFLTYAGTNFVMPAGLAIETVTATTSAANFIAGSDIANTLTSQSGADTLYGGEGASSGDSLVGNAGNDLLVGGAFTGVWANDSLDSNGTENDTLDGGANDDTLYGGGGNDLLIGGTGNDSLLGGDGNDTLRGGAGADTMDGGTGTNTLDYTGNTGALSINLSTQSTAGSAGDGAGDVISNMQNVIGGTGNDTLLGSTAANRLDGDGGNDSLVGSASDTLVGGTGNDSFSIDSTILNLGTRGTVDGGAGTDTVRFSAWSAAGSPDINAGVITNIEVLDFSVPGVNAGDITMGTSQVRGFTGVASGNASLTVIYNDETFNGGSDPTGGALTTVTQTLTDANGTLTLQWQHVA
jgi:Ca2+-binding RTX toxin-like protein